MLHRKPKEEVVEEIPFLSLTPFSDEYLTDAYVGWLNDQTLMQYSEQRHRSHTLESCRAYKEQMEKEGHSFWAILSLFKTEEGDGEPPASWEHIGNLTAYIDRPNQRAELAILIGNRRFQGKGLGRRAWQMASDFLLDSEEIRKITAGTMATNIPMLRIMESTGMTEEGRRPGYFLVNGSPVDLVLMGQSRTFLTPNVLMH